MKRFSIIVWSLLLADCVTIPTPKPQLPQPPTNPPAVLLTDPTFPSQCSDIWQQELGRPLIDPKTKQTLDAAGLAGCLNQFQHGVLGEAIRAVVHDSPEGVAHRAALQKAADDAAAAAEAAKRLGPLHVDGTRFATPEGSTYRPIFASELSVLRRTPAERDALLDEWKALGFNGIRVFAGRLAWAGQTAESARAALPDLLTAANQRGMRVLVTAVTDSRDGGYDVPAHLQAVADTLAQHPANLSECANEYYHPTQSNDVNDAAWLDRTCRAAFARAGLPWALGAPPFDEPTPDGVWPIPSGDFITAHLDRGRDTWNQVRRVRELRAILEAAKKPVLNSEPMGAAEADDPGRRLSDPSFFFALGLLDRLFDIGGVFHSQAGLDALPLGPIQRECARAFVAGATAIPTTEALVYQNVGWRDSPVSSAQFAEVGGVVVRAYSFLSDDGAYVVILHTSTDLPPYSISWADGWGARVQLPSRPHVTLFHIVR